MFQGIGLPELIDSLSFQRFIQYLASSNSTFNLSNFLDKGGVQGEKQQR